MTTKKFQFPHYLGFYKAMPERYFVDELLLKEKLSYGVNGKVNLEVEVTSTSVKLIEFCDEKIIGITSEKDLKQAFFRHYQCIDPFKSAIYDDWFSSIVAIRNVYADYIIKENINYLYYPALVLTDIRVPIGEDQIILAEKLITSASFKSCRSWLQSAKFSISYGEYIETFKKPLLSIICPLAYTYDILKEISDTRLISCEKLFRPLVGHSISPEKYAVRQFFGREKDSWKQYNITYEINPPTIMI
ncbi:MAG: hypothetical protein ACK4V4_08255 [Sphingobacteriales bacterium]|jgi:hypothetical protein